MKDERIETIYKICQMSGTVYVDDLVTTLGVSHATIRRDLQKMDDLKLVHRFYGGATINNDQVIEPSMNAKHLINMQKKKSIAKYAASLIKDNDIVYIDAGTTTESMIDYICAKNILVVTQALSVMNKLFERQIKCYTLGGYIKFRTNIIVDNDTLERIAKQNFNVAFLGCNGIHPMFGFSTTNDIEAMLKSIVISRTVSPYVLADSTKFNIISSLRFAGPQDVTIITDVINPTIDYSPYKQVINVE